MDNIRKFEHIATVVAIVVCACSFAATAIIVFGHLTVFNQNLRTNKLLNGALLGLLPLVMAALLGSLFSGRLRFVQRPVLLTLTTLLTMNLLLIAFDKIAISVRGSLVPAANYSLFINGGTFFLTQPNEFSPYGFRTPRAEPRNPPGKRVLFLGDSYVSGSGSTFATNYPQVVEAELQRLYPGEPVTVFSAGVNGSGVDEDRYLYDYLVREGYRFDVVVLSFYLGADQSNDIRGTTRIAIAGQPQRVHTSVFLRAFYPLDSTLFRFMVYLKAASRDWGDAGGKTVAKDASCQPTLDFVSFVTERGAYNYSEGASQRIDIAFNQQLIDNLEQDAKRNGAKFAVVLLPDLNESLEVNRNRFAGIPMDYDWIRNYLTVHAQGRYSLLDLSTAYRDRLDLFRCSDTHWNDAGNLQGGKLVADFLSSNFSGELGSRRQVGLMQAPSAPH